MAKTAIKKTPAKAKPTKAASAAEVVKPAVVKIAGAKGRPMLTWVGKRPLGHVQAFPAQLIERFGKADEPNLLFHGDNKDVLAWLLANGYRGKVQLVYIDPPFDSGADYVRKVSLRGPKGSMKVDGETYSLGEQIQYTDIWANDNYLQFMYERLLLLKEVLSVSGSIYVHLDSKRIHHVRLILDEVFGEDSFRNQVSWKRTSAHAGASQFGAVTDFLLFYSLDPSQAVWNQQFQQMTDVHLERHYRHKDDKGVFALGELTAPGTRKGPSGDAWRGFNPTTMGRHWARVPDELDRMDAAGLIFWPPTEGAWPRMRRYLADSSGRACTDFWDDIDPINMVGSERENFPTQKAEALVERVIQASSNPNDVVLDCFIGSGTTAAVAQKLGRRWIGADINKGAIQTTLKRLQAIITEQSEAAKPARQGQLLDLTEPVPAGPLGIDVYRVNDYDLQIQHNEAVALACEHLGVQRNRGDRFFDGTRGKQLVKIIPFNHPLSPVDLDVLQQELKSRPDEDRGILLVCLGMEMAAQRAVDDWNAHRKGKTAVNRIEVVELRSDPKYGGFMAHAPAQGKVSISRKKDTIVVSIDDFISPTIVERLRQQAGVLNPKIDDWRAMVDSVMIDPAYDGTVFNVTLSDVPEKKTDFVEGRYELPAPKEKTTVAVKITDMLGEEVVFVKTL